MNESRKANLAAWQVKFLMHETMKDAGGICYVWFEVEVVMERLLSLYSEYQELTSDSKDSSE